MCNYRSVATKKTDFDSKQQILNFLQDLNFFALNATRLSYFLLELFYQ